jgi:3-oxoacyl-[acyl-carrier-protein] synthase III
MGAGILGTGVYLPKQILTNEELAERFGVTPDWIFQRTGIRQRHVVAPQQTCSDLAIAAARQALENSKTLPEEIGLIILATTMGDAVTPATAALVQHALGASRTACYDVSAGCSGFVYALVTGCHLVRSNLCEKILVIGSEVVTRLVNPDDLNTSILFGDGAGAAVLGAVPEGYGLLAADMGTDGSLFHSLYVPRSANPIERAHEMRAEGSQYVQMDGRAVFAFGMQVLGDSTLRLLAKKELEVGDIDLIIPHQANYRIIQAAANLLDLPMEKIMQNIEHCGNTAVASIAIALHEALEGGRIARDSLVALVGFGGGLSWGSGLFRWY